MIKILPVDKIREADAYTIQHEPIVSIDLMERAATACYEWLQPYMKQQKKVKMICGPGNNGGDGLALARMLAKDDLFVEVWIVRFTDKVSGDFQINFDRLKKIKGVQIHEIRDSHDIGELDADDIIIDAILGSGLSKPVKGFIGDVIKKINDTKAVTVAIDIPSGLYADTSSKQNEGAIVEADYTLSFEFPKYAFMFAENDPYVGDWHVLPICLHAGFIDSLTIKNYFTTHNTASSLFKVRKKFSHKGTYGHALLIAGSNGKMGAAVLATKACLRTGVGLLTTHIPSKGNQIMQTAVPEAMLSLDRFENYFSAVPDTANYNAIGIGPGLGMQEQSGNAMKVLIQESGLPLLFDADALNLLSENKTWLGFLRPNSILTPHLKEFERLVGKSDNDFERIEKAKEFAFKYQFVIVLKGAHTCVITPKGECHFNSTGNPGMATGGSGDVLTGVILSLLAQGYTSTEACIMGVYLHGLAGDIASDKKGAEALIASDIIDNMGKAFKKLY